MIPHKCTFYCEPDEGIHCVPTMGLATTTLESARRFFKEEQGNTLDVLKVLPDADVNPSIIDKIDFNGSGWRRDRRQEHVQGFLIWLRDKEIAAKAGTRISFDEWGNG